MIVVLVLAAGALAGGLYLWLRGHQAERRAALSRGVARTPPTHAAKKAWEAAVRAEKIDWHDIESFRRAWEAALGTGDVKKWAPVLGELMNPKYRQSEAVPMLVSLLGNGNWQVKALAAQILLQRGSREGVPTLMEALRAASAGEDVPESVVLKAAVSLKTAGEAINQSDLQGSYQKYPLDELLEVAAFQGDSWAAEAVQQGRLLGSPKINTELDAAYLGMADDQSIAIYHKLLTSTDPDLRAIGNWALYRATGDQANLQNVVDMARVYSGLDTVSPGGAAGSAYAVGLLSSTEDPKATQTMEEIADLAAQDKSRGSFGLNEALSALYFVDKDFDFIDQRIMSYLNGEYVGTGSSGTVLWQIASARRTPEIERLAYAKKLGAYDLYFVRMAEYPILRSQTPAVKARIPRP